MEQYENFLLFIGAMFVPLFGVVLTDYFIIRRRVFDLQALYEEGGKYWYIRGYNPSAIAAWAAGFLVFEGIALMKYPVGGSVPAILASGVIYLLLSRRRKQD